ncbi:MAG: SGNH/GDSL hydrolase family protein [Actinobacteria bacterium]|nr:SGNH/GDSL hydrolase family protein [Actinomycetota bacterium]
MKARVAALALLLPLAASCASAPTQTGAVPATAPVEEPVVFVSLGGNETLNRGLENSFKNGWTQQLFVNGLPRSAIHVNLSSPDATVASAIERQLPKALESRPTLVTLWFGEGDVRTGTSDSAFTRDLTALVQQLEQSGVRQIVVLAREAPAAPGSRFAAAAKDVATAMGVLYVALPGTSGNPVDPTTQTAIADTIRQRLAG